MCIHPSALLFPSRCCSLQIPALAVTDRVVKSELPNKTSFCSDVAPTLFLIALFVLGWEKKILVRIWKL